MHLLVLFADYHVVVDKRPQAVFGLILLGTVALFATRHTFSSNSRLSSPAVAQIIGTSNPWVARSVCILSALIGWGGVAIFGAAILGYG